MEEKTVKQKQINLTLPESLLDAAKDFITAYGYKNIQELATEALRDKIYHTKVTKPSTEQKKETPTKRHKSHYIL
tara:strand:- start:3002 stop:3226 length:225 start_codon:yes stop_codon:yes gene_type:complete